MVVGFYLSMFWFFVFSVQCHLRRLNNIIPRSTRRRFNVDRMSYEVAQRRIDVETMLCV